MLTCLLAYLRSAVAWDSSLLHRLKDLEGQTHLNTVETHLKHNIRRCLRYGLESYPPFKQQRFKISLPRLHCEIHQSSRI